MKINVSSLFFVDRMTKRQLHDAMVAMDTDGSGEVEFDEFTNWWINGVMHPPKGSSVFRMLSDKLEGKCKNVRYADRPPRIVIFLQIRVSSFCVTFFGLLCHLVFCALCVVHKRFFLMLFLAGQGLVKLSTNRSVSDLRTCAFFSAGRSSVRSTRMPTARCRSTNSGRACATSGLT